MRCFVLLSVDLGTEILSSEPILSALTTCGRPYGAPSTLNGSSACPCAATSSGFPFAHIHVHDDDD